MSAESITKLTARSKDMEFVNGGIPEITEADVCHALARLKVPGAALLLRVKIAGQEFYRYPLAVELHRRHKRGTSELSFIAVNEYCAPALCKTCNGRESHKVGNLLIVCPVCHGSGRYRHPDPPGQLGLNPRQWRAMEGIYSDMLCRLSVWESLGIAAINSISDD